MPIDPKSVVWDEPDPASIKWDAAPSKPAASWKDLPKNILPSAGRFVSSIAHSVMHPIDTASGLLDTAAGGLRNLAPEGIRNALDSIDPNPQAAQQATAQADAVGQFYKDRYGGLSNIKNTLITDPVGAAADASTILGAGAGVAGLRGPNAVSSALSAASKYTNPLSAVAPVAKGIANVGGAAAKNVLGMTTGVGPENIAQAAKAGFNGTRGDTSFIDNITGRANFTDVLDDAKQGIAEMGRAKSAEYTKNMASIAKDKKVLSFDGIDAALGEAEKIGSFKGQTLNAKAAEAISEIDKIVMRWKMLPPAEYHTPVGLDALKQKIGGVLESLPFEEKTARLAAGKVYSAAKAEIAKQAPVYADTMKAYSESSDLIREIERALSLGKQAAADTAMRKLQSLSRNNANTNYGNRLDLARTLEEQGGVNLLPSVAGQAMNSWTPRSLSAQGGGLATMGAAFINPAILAAVPFQSPKAVGLGAYGLGRASGVASRGANMLGLTSEKAALAGLLAEQANQLSGRRP